MPEAETQNAGTTGAAGANGGQHWYSSLPPEIGNHETIKQIPDVPTLAKSYLDAQSEIGRRVRFPGSDAKPEERQAFTNKLSEGGFRLAPDNYQPPPESPDKYEIKRPDNAPWDGELEKVAREAFHKVGASNEVFKAAVDVWNGWAAKINQAAEEASKKEFTTNLDAIKKEWGADYNANAEKIARLGVSLFGTQEEAAKFKGNNDPKWINALLKVAKMMETDDGFIREGMNPIMDDARSKLNAILGAKQDHPYWDRNHPGHDAAVEEAYRLNQQIHGTKQVPD